MKYTEYLKHTTGQDPSPDERKRIQEALAATDRALHQQEASRLATKALLARVHRVMAEREMTEQEAWTWIATEDGFDRASQRAQEAKRTRMAATLAPPPRGGRFELKSAPGTITLDEGTATIRGLASTFGTLDLVGDVVEVGAYAASLQEAKAKGGRFLWPLLWQHSVAHPIGAVVDAHEEQDGLHIEARIAVDTELGQYAYSLLQKRMISGLSVGFVARKDRYVAGVRHLLEIDLHEVSTVTFPAAPGAQVTSTGN